nr:DUF1015 domain-containing protein [uncultured Flavobacterium sp.]
MAKITPFKAVLPTADKVALVTTRSYDEYSATELASWLDFNPFSFLHIVNPAYVNQQKIGNNERFKMVANKYNDFKRNGILVKQEKPAMFLYKIESKKQTFVGIMAGTSVSDYNENKIKKHENTLEYRVNTLKDYFKITQFNTEPVLMMYPEDATLDQWIQNKQNQTPLYDFSTTNRERHTLWIIDSEDEINFITKTFESFENLYIADGHHRSASAQLLHQENSDESNSNLNHFMSFLISENNIKINEFNRLIHDLNNHTTADFLALISEEFEVTKREEQIWKPTQKFEFGMYLDGNFYSLKLKKIPNSSNKLETLDAQLLYDKLLNPILGIGDLRTDSRINYIPGNKNLLEMIEKIDNGEYKVGFNLFPASIEEIKFLADNNLTMPPKSTYIEPKFRSGLIIYEL